MVFFVSLIPTVALEQSKSSASVHGLGGGGGRIERYLVLAPSIYTLSIPTVALQHIKSSASVHCGGRIETPVTFYLCCFCSVAR